MLSSFLYIKPCWLLILLFHSVFILYQSSEAAFTRHRTNFRKADKFYRTLTSFTRDRSALRSIHTSTPSWRFLFLFFFCGSLSESYSRTKAEPRSKQKTAKSLTLPQEKKTTPKKTSIEHFSVLNISLQCFFFSSTDRVSLPTAKPKKTQLTQQTYFPCCQLYNISYLHTRYG